MLQEVINNNILNAQKQICTCIPGHVISFNPVTQQATVQPGVQRVDNNGITSSPPPVSGVPVLFAGSGSGFTIEHEVPDGTPGLIIYQQRAISGWKNTGGVAINPVSRFHSAQDAVFIPGVRSLAGVIQNHGNNGIRIRNVDGTQSIWIRNDQTTVISNGEASTTYGADKSITITNGSGTMILEAGGDIVLNGLRITPQGQITIPSGGGITGSNGVQYETHRHGGVETGSGTSGVPV